MINHPSLTNYISFESQDMKCPWCRISMSHCTTGIIRDETYKCRTESCYGLLLATSDSPFFDSFPYRLDEVAFDLPNQKHHITIMLSQDILRVSNYELVTPIRPLVAVPQKITKEILSCPISKFNIFDIELMEKKIKLYLTLS